MEGDDHPGDWLMPRSFCIQSLRLAPLRIRNLQLGALFARVFCIGILLLLFTGSIHPPFVLADESMPSEHAEEPSSAAPLPPSRETPPPTPRQGGSGKARNPYDMETLKRFDAGSHRQS
jgi:hypothetical protein